MSYDTVKNIWSGLGATEPSYVPPPLKPRVVVRVNLSQETNLGKVLQAIKDHPGTSCKELKNKSTLTILQMRGVLGRLLKLKLIKAEHDVTKHATYFPKELK